MRKRPGALQIGIAAASGISVLWSILSAALMISYRERGDFGYTGATDYTVRMIALLACTLCLSLAMLRLAVSCLRGGAPGPAAHKAYFLLNLGLLCAIVVEGISLYREFQNSARLLEDAMYLLLTLGAGIAMLIGLSMTGNEKGVFLSGLLAALLLTACTALGLIFFRENTHRAVNVMYYLHRLAYPFPFFVAAAAAKLLAPREEIRVVPAQEAEGGSDCG